MGLRAIAAADAKAILEDSGNSGFGWPLTLTSPAGVVSPHVGFATDVAESVDPETGLAVTGRRSSVAIALSSLAELPAAVHDRARRPWLVAVADVSLAAAVWKVVEVRPDRALGIVVLFLEAYIAD